MTVNGERVAERLWEIVGDVNDGDLTLVEALLEIEDLAGEIESGEFEDGEDEWDGDWEDGEDWEDE